MVTIDCIRNTVTHRGQNYPIFLGSLEAGELSDLATVPSFGRGFT